MTPIEPSSNANQPTAAQSGPAAPEEHPPATKPAGPTTDVLPPGVPSHDGVGPEWEKKVKTLLIGRPRDLADHRVFHQISLVAFFAWVGLGADGLSSSCYGPSEAFQHLGQFRYLAVFLSAATVATVVIISLCYSHIIEEFPAGGGGYLVASKELGKKVGVVSGSALVVDYVLTITVSIAAAGDAIFGLLDSSWTPYKKQVEIGAIILLIVLNLRGVKESIIALMPIFLVFLLTHILVIGGVFGLHIGGLGHIANSVNEEVRRGLVDPRIGFVGLVSTLMYAYSLGAGTYTGIEAVSNSMPVMREPKVATAKTTMMYMAFSLSVMAGGLMLGYLLLDISPVDGQTMNQVLTSQLVLEFGLADTWYGDLFILVTILSEGALLFVAAQAGFIDGPRVLANMARDSWVPHWFANLSERLTTHNGIMLMGISALAALIYTNGEVTQLLVMYSINVFVTFSLSMIAMCRHWLNRRGSSPVWKKRLALFSVGAVMCCSILAVTVVEKFMEGGWMTLGVTGVLVAVCFMINAEYLNVVKRLRKLNESLGSIPTGGQPCAEECDQTQPTAAILVGGYGGLGIHTFLNSLRLTPNYFKNVIFLSVGVVESGNFKGVGAVEDLRANTEEALKRYVLLARRIGIPSTSYMAMGTDPVEELESLCAAVAKEYPKVIFFAGQLVFHKDKWYHRILHNETAFSLQRRLQWAGLPVVILPTRVR